ncbi:hypothetical protein P7C71_g808, partial [Lecanoromycetidae sp. Uapishka_2]
MATVMSTLQVDPSKTGKYPVSIIDSLQEDRPRKRRKVNVQLNHRSKVTHALTELKIKPTSEGNPNSYALSVTNKDNDEGYLYTGGQQSSSSLALVYDSSTQSFALDKIDADFRFNLKSTPSDKDAASLAARYEQLDTGHSQQPENDEGDVVDENNADPDTEPPDPNNPYDYRHFLNRVRAGHSPSPAPSSVSTPIPNHNLSSPILSGSSHTRPPRPSKPKSRDHPRPRHLSPNPREEADADNEASDNDVLTIDMGDAVPNSRSKPWRHVLGKLNEGGMRSGPISLRSAASSMSPSLRGDSGDEKEVNGDEEEEEEKEESRSNADVEEIDLGDGVDFVSQGAAGEEVETPGNGWDDDSGDLEAEFEQALMSEAEQDQRNALMNGEALNGINGVAPQRMVEESSEESEEE